MAQRKTKLARPDSETRKALDKLIDPMAAGVYAGALTYGVSYLLTDS